MMGVMGIQHLGGLLCCSQSSPDDPVEYGKDEKRYNGGHGNPGPGSVEQDIVP